MILPNEIEKILGRKGGGGPGACPLNPPLVNVNFHSNCLICIE